MTDDHGVNVHIRSRWPRALDAQSPRINHRRSSCAVHRLCWQLCSALPRLPLWPSRRRHPPACNEARRPATSWNAAHGRSTFPINTRPWDGLCIRCRMHIGNRSFEHTGWSAHRFGRGTAPGRCLCGFSNSCARPRLRVEKIGRRRTLMHMRRSGGRSWSQHRASAVLHNVRLSLCSRPFEGKMLASV